MKGIGNYRAIAPQQSTERRVAQIAVFHGPRASVQFVDGSTYTMPAEPLRKLGLVPGSRFLLVITYRGRDVVSVRVELQAEARPSTAMRPMPKVMVRDGLKTTTRR